MFNSLLGYLYSYSHIENILEYSLIISCALVMGKLSKQYAIGHLVEAKILLSYKKLFFIFEAKFLIVLTRP